MVTRADIRSGDLLIWETDKSSSLSRLFLNIVRTLTRSQYAHVAIAWRLMGYLFVIEATMPFVRMAPIKDKDEFYHIATNVNWNRGSEKFLLALVGKLYSLIDGIRAYLGKTTKTDESYQCAEICNIFYREINGIAIDPNANTPLAIVKEIQRVTGNPINLIKAEGEESTFDSLDKYV